MLTQWINETVLGPPWQWFCRPRSGMGGPVLYTDLSPAWLWAQVLVLELSDVPSEQAVSVASVDLLQDREGFTWKGHERLSPRTGPLPWPAGFQPRVLIQCLPPAAVTAVTLHTEWSLVAFGTSHGFGLFDYQRKSPVLTRCVGAGCSQARWGLSLHPAPGSCGTSGVCPLPPRPQCSL